jgi:DNA adenine methylase
MYILQDKLPSCSPFVKWAGGKTQLLPKLNPFIPSDFNRYFEPFVGSGAMFFHLVQKTDGIQPFPHSSYISDINSDLITDLVS